MNWPEFWSLLFGLGVGHAVTDVVMQDPRVSSMSRMKQIGDRSFGSEIHWPYWLLAHGLLNGWAVTVVTDSPALGMMECGAHILIDWGKMRGWYGVHVDQAAHWGCKVIWAYLTVRGGI